MTCKHSRLLLGLMACLLFLSAACDLERRRREAEGSGRATQGPTWPEEAAEPEPAPPEPELEPPPPEPEPPPARAVWTQPTGWQRAIGPDTLDGRWVASRGGEFESLVEVDGTLVRATSFESGERVESTLFELISVDGPHATLRAAAGGEVVEVHALFLTLDEVLVWIAGEDQLGVLRRVGEMPNELLGEWQSIQADGSGRLQTLVIEQAHIRMPGSGLTMPIYPLARTGDTIDAVGEMSGHYVFLHFRRLSDGVFLSWTPQDDRFAVLYREGMRPSWLAGLGRTGDSGQLDWAPRSPSAGEMAPPGTAEPRAPTATEAGDEDPSANLQRLAERAVAYFAASSPRQFPPSTDWTPPGDGCGRIDAAQDSWDAPTWAALDFQPVTATTYQYRFISDEAESFEAQARLDRDCDGVFDKWSMAGFGGSTPGASDIVRDNAGE